MSDRQAQYLKRTIYSFESGHESERTYDGHELTHAQLFIHQINDCPITYFNNGFCKFA